MAGEKPRDEAGSSSSDDGFGDILQRFTREIQAYRSRHTPRQREIEARLSAMDNAKDERMRRRDELRREMESLDRDDAADDALRQQLKAEFVDIAAGKWKEAQNQLSSAVLSLGVISLDSPLGLFGPQDATPHEATPPAGNGDPPAAASTPAEWEASSAVDGNSAGGQNRTPQPREASASEELEPRRSGRRVVHASRALGSATQPDGDGGSRKRGASQLDEQQPEPAPKRTRRAGERTIEFDELYQDGKAEYKHFIFERPKDSNKWYIVRCDEHGLHFGFGALNGALNGARSHVHSKKHGNLPKNSNIALRELGIRVLNCNADKAKANNDAFERALSEGYQIYSSEDAYRHKSQQGGAVARNKRQGSENFEGIEDPKVGEIYRVWYAIEHTYYPALILPTGRFESVGVAGELAATELIDIVPSCYRRQGSRILGWAEDFKDGGPRSRSRKFPVLYFDEHVEVPLDGDFEIPVEGPALLGWVKARDLRTFDIDDPECQGLQGFSAAKQYYQRMDRIQSRHGRSIAGRTVREQHRDPEALSRNSRRPDEQQQQQQQRAVSPEEFDPWLPGEMSLDAREDGHDRTEGESGLDVSASNGTRLRNVPNGHVEVGPATRPGIRDPKRQEHAAAIREAQAAAMQAAQAEAIHAAQTLAQRAFAKFGSLGVQRNGDASANGTGHGTRPDASEAADTTALRGSIFGPRGLSGVYDVD